MMTPDVVIVTVSLIALCLSLTSDLQGARVWSELMKSHLPQNGFMTIPMATSSGSLLSPVF